MPGRGNRLRDACTNRLHADEALQILQQYPIDILIADLRVSEMGGITLLKRVREAYPRTAVMILAQHSSLEAAMEATRSGSDD